MSDSTAASAARQPVRAATSLGALPTLASAGVVVHQGRCVEVRNRHATCHRCADACTSGAIDFVDGRLVVDATRCVSCGTCATVCPTCAIEAADPTDAELAASVAEAARALDGHAVIACAHALVSVADRYDPQTVACVTCLGRVDESLLADLAARGVTDVTLVGDACATCEHACGRAACEDAVASARSLVDAWGGRLPVTFADELPAPCLAAPDPARPPVFDVRRAGVMARSDADEPPGAPAEPEGRMHVGPDGTLPHYVPTRRGRILASLAELGPTPSHAVESRLWASVFIDPERCGSCRMCAVFCPTGALRKFDDRTTATFGVEHVPGLCVACHCCADVCPEQAITIVDEVYPADLDGEHAERFEMRPREIEPGRPDALEKRMRGLLAGSRFVNYA